MRAALLALLFALLGGPAWPAPIQPDFPQTMPRPAPKPGAPVMPNTPPGVTVPGARCIAAAVTEDIGTSDTYLYREYFEPSRTRRQGDGMALPGPPRACPATAATQAARNALIACHERAANPANCVYGDMDRTFMTTTDVSDSSAAHSTCLAIEARYLGIACVPRAGIDVCSIACGQDETDALEAAKTRCKSAHNADCTLANAVEIAPPDLLSTEREAAGAPAAAPPAAAQPAHPSPSHPRPVRKLPEHGS